MKAGARCGRLDNTCHHFDYRLRDTLHALSEKLGYSGSDNVLPDHRPSDQSKSVICKPGVAYGIDTISEDTNHLQRSMPAPSSCPFPAEVRDKDRLATFDTPVFNLKPRLNGPGGARGPLAAAPIPASAGPSQSTSHPEGVGYLTTDQFLKQNSAYFAASPHALRAVASVRDKVCLLSQADCVNDARVLRRTAWMERGIIFPAAASARDVLPALSDIEGVRTIFAEEGLLGLLSDLKKPAAGVTAAQQGSQFFGNTATAQPAQTMQLESHGSRCDSGAGSGGGGGGGGGSRHRGASGGASAAPAPGSSKRGLSEDQSGQTTQEA